MVCAHDAKLAAALQGLLDKAQAKDAAIGEASSHWAAGRCLPGPGIWRRVSLLSFFTLPQKLASSHVAGLVEGLVAKLNAVGDAVAAKYAGLLGMLLNKLLDLNHAKSEVVSKILFHPKPLTATIGGTPA